eukprot:CAMPEP_0178669610 /NCGR_PEP_ID=MMETSP0698-20121128/32222_1 /TAXON_ID=265572 /ORGANISM="Extubocellulus spinifer, Strain CCMP396" /LENGTH=1051 /DNA_ID=CAMNT_0020313289 /DNA_START=109 /DNA_END=3265 /DNA_ORIENTATION=+
MSYHSAYVHKPETALRRAQELQSIRQPDAALSLLHDVLSSGRHRTWSPVYEKIMITYLDLCIDLNKAREAKDGLHQYRNLSQSQAPGSLEIVIRHLLDTADRNCREAKARADAGAADAAAAVTSVSDADDLDAATPTSGANVLLLTTMSSDPLQTQRDSALLLPRLKFLWESYRAVLDILRSSSKLERLYHGTAVGALRFCGTYKRRTEFRRLCDMLRLHLANLQKYGGNATPKQNNKVRGWEGWSTEAIELHLQTRFVQLETASALRLYTEGFRTVEDIYNILQISHSRRKVAGVSAAPPKAKLMATYYEKLTTLFWVSENYLFHAFAWYKFYTLCREYNRGMTAEQKTLQASAVLLSALCIPPSKQESAASAKDGQDGNAAIASTLADDIAKEKTARMATLLGFHTRNPTREALLSEIRAKRVMDDVPDYLRELYTLLEENSNPLILVERELYTLLEDNSNPLILVERAAPLLERLRTEVGAPTADEDKKDEDDVEQAGPLGRYVKPLTSVLLLKLLHSLSASYHTISLDHIKTLTSGLGISFIEVEKTIVSTSYSKGKSSSLRVRIDHRANCLRFGDAATAGGGRQLESDAMRSQLTTLSKQLSSVCTIINPTDEVHSAAVRQAIFNDVRSNLESEHESMLARKELIEKRKEEAERLAQEKIKEERRIKAEQAAAAKAEEERRLAREQQLREREKLAKVQREMEAMEKKRYLEAMGKNTENMTEDQLALVDTAALAKEHAEKANKKKDEAERKVREMSKKLDYIVRATRIEELPLVKAKNEEKIKAERERHEADVIAKAKKAKAQWEQNVKDKEALEAHSIFSHLSIFEEKAMVGRRAAHVVLCAEEDKRAEMEAEEGKLNRARRRKEAEERRIQAEKEEEERRIQAEKEEAERLKREEEKRKRQAEEEERRKKEVARMDEAREKRERERADQNRPTDAPSSSALDAASPVAEADVVGNMFHLQDEEVVEEEEATVGVADTKTVVADMGAADTRVEVAVRVEVVGGTLALAWVDLLQEMIASAVIGGTAVVRLSKETVGGETRRKRSI